MTKCENAIINLNNYKIYSILTRLNYTQQISSSSSSSSSENNNNNKIKLKYLNIGAGTTGTRVIYTIFCKKYNIISLHYSNHCNVNTTPSTITPTVRTISTTNPRSNKLIVWYNHLTKCTINIQNKCKSIEILQSLQTRLPIILSEYEFISDTPVDMLFLELYAYMRFKVSVFATIREPKSWALRRVEQHPNTLICKENLWKEESIFHPFDIIGCLLLKEKVEDALTTVFEIAYSKPWRANYKQQNIFENYGQPDSGKMFKLSSAYTKMNSIHNEIVTWSHSLHNYGNYLSLERGRSLQIICLWDDEDTTPQPQLPESNNGNNNGNQRAISAKLLERIKRDILDLTFEENHIRRLNIQNFNNINDTNIDNYIYYNESYDINNMSNATNHFNIIDFHTNQRSNLLESNDKMKTSLTDTLSSEHQWIIKYLSITLLILMFSRILKVIVDQRR